MLSSGGLVTLFAYIMSLSIAKTFSEHLNWFTLTWSIPELLVSANTLFGNLVVINLFFPSYRAKEYAQGLLHTREAV